MKDRFGIDTTHKNVTVDGNTYQIEPGKTIDGSTKDYKIHPYTFLGEKGTRADGCVFEIFPHGSTNVMRVIDETSKSQEIAIKGKGWFLGVSPDGEMIVQEVGESVIENPLIEQWKGWIGVWIAGDAGMEVLDITEPPFNPSIETPVKRDDQNIPSNFWETYDNLRTPTKT